MKNPFDISKFALTMKTIGRNIIEESNRINMERNQNKLVSEQFVLYVAVSIFAIFIGSQITEGFLLVPHWKAISAGDFYAYYSEFGPSIGQFYTVLTIVAALIPIALVVYCKYIGSKASQPAMISSLFAVLFIACFYVYFKGTNELFYEAALNDADLKKELVIWSSWHWGRVLIECLSLIFLIRSAIQLRNKNT